MDFSTTSVTAHVQGLNKQEAEAFMERAVAALRTAMQGARGELHTRFDHTITADSQPPNAS